MRKLVKEFLKKYPNAAKKIGKKEATEDFKGIIRDFEKVTKLKITSLKEFEQLLSILSPLAQDVDDLQVEYSADSGESVEIKSPRELVDELVAISYYWAVLTK